MDSDEKQQWQDKKDKRKANRIASNGHFYPDLYTLAKVLQGKFINNRDNFPKMSTHPTTPIHQIGILIAGRRKHINTADIHNQTDEAFLLFAQRDEYAKRTSFYFLVQSGVYRASASPVRYQPQLSYGTNSRRQGPPCRHPNDCHISSQCLPNIGLGAMVSSLNFSQSNR